MNGTGKCMRRVMCSLMAVITAVFMFGILPLAVPSLGTDVEAVTAADVDFIKTGVLHLRMKM